jgi:uncharacterized SAM-binding protein YcdF (DUF218 family)
MMHILLSPLTWVLLFGFVLLAGRWRLSGLTRALIVVLELLLVLVMCPLGANVLVGEIEDRVPRTDACATPAPAAIVVLSAGLQRAPENAGDFTALGADSITRALSGIILWRKSAASTLVFAGGGPFEVSESAVLQNFAEQLGVPPGMIRREGISQTTWENAEQLRALKPALPDRIWLVSSAIHLPRALMAFRAAGFQPCPYVSDRRYLPPGGIGYYLPQSSALRKSELAIHEFAGELLYRWRATRAGD